MGDNFSVWRKHFENQARGLIPHDSAFYKVSSERGNGEESKGESKMTVISPSQQIVERAKKQLKYAEVIYDPVTGITQHSVGKPRSVKRLKKKAPQRKNSKIGKGKQKKVKTKKRCVKKKNCRNKKAKSRK